MGGKGSAFLIARIVVVSQKLTKAYEKVLRKKTRNMQAQSEKGSEWPHHAIFI